MNDRDPPTHCAGCSAAAPRCGIAVACHIASFALRHWRLGTRGLPLDRPSGGCGAKLVAALAAGAHGVRRLALFGRVLVCRQLAADQSRCADRRRMAAAQRRGRRPISRGPGGLPTPFASSRNGCSRTVVDHFHTAAGSQWRPAWEQFCRDQAHWLDDYALFAALKEKYSPASYLDWPEALVRRDADALAQARRELARQIDQERLAQFLVYRQSQQLKEYAHAQGVRLIGDVPFFVSSESSDVWAAPELVPLG